MRERQFSPIPTVASSLPANEQRPGLTAWHGASWAAQSKASRDTSRYGVLRASYLAWGVCGEGLWGPSHRHGGLAPRDNGKALPATARDAVASRRVQEGCKSMLGLGLWDFQHRSIPTRISILYLGSGYTAETTKQRRTGLYPPERLRADAAKGSSVLVSRSESKQPPLCRPLQSWMMKIEEGLNAMPHRPAFPGEGESAPPRIQRLSAVRSGQWHGDPVLKLRRLGSL